MDSLRSTGKGSSVHMRKLRLCARDKGQPSTCPPQTHRLAEKVDWSDPAMLAKLTDAYSRVEEMTKRLRASSA